MPLDEQTATCHKSAEFRYMAGATLLREKLSEVNRQLKL